MSAASTGKERSRCWDVAKYAILSRLVALLLGIASNAVINDYDSSASLILPTKSSAGQGGGIRRLAQVVVHWDAFYFTHIAESGYVYEQEHAFFPLLPLLMRLLSRTVLVPLESRVGPQLALVVAGVLISNVSFVLASTTLYKLGRDTLRSERLAYAGALLFILAPSSMFMSAVYTESLFAYLVFSALLLIERRRYVLAALVLCVSTLCRSNAIVYAGFFWWSLVVLPYVQQRRGSQQAEPIQMAFKAAFQVACAAALTAISALGFVAFQAYGRQALCHQQLLPRDHSARPYCSGAATVYGFVQEHYWDNGFLRYYTPNQIPNFALAAPMVALSICGLWAYATSDPARAVTLGVCRRREEDSAGPSRRPLLASAYLGDRLLPHIYLWALLLCVAVTTMNIQVITRFFSSVPVVFWYAAHVVCGSGSSNRRQRRAVVWYFAGYGLAGVVLFSNFFPPA
ncbi:ER membrane glycoprotein subunit of the GPI transamidase complex-like protein [Coemansia sp. IMI 209127]|nr:ER membrane glycoprotein subunit of the GPI transamidase complex-like protein [Coemansia sp. IMI 209127]